jgi:hypothetical protein
MVGSKPLLEGHAEYFHNIEKKAYEQKIIYNLKQSKSLNSTKLLMDFKQAQDAQQVIMTITTQGGAN